MKKIADLMVPVPMVKTDDIPAYEAALEAALDEFDATTALLRRSRKDVRSHENRLSKLRQTIAHLSDLMPPERRKAIEPRIRDVARHHSIDPDAGTRSYREAINSLLANPEKAWRAEDLERALHEKGLNPSAKFAYNTFQRLFEKGLLVKVRRGVYRVNEMNIGLVIPEDFEDGE